MQQVILDASSDLHSIPRHTEALMFSIYLLAITSLSSQECEGMFNEQRSDLLTKYSHATQQALINARFLKSLSLSTLQAFCIYLVSYPIYKVGAVISLKFLDNVVFFVLYLWF
jgi:ABC-type spermidine/putrescine transport system permease subunit I